MAMNLIHRKDLPAFLAQEGFVAAKVVSFETYGHKTMAYIRVDDMAERAKLERMLEKHNVPVSRNYFPGKPYVEARIKYFRAFGWDA
jgi:hypothetical protein